MDSRGLLAGARRSVAEALAVPTPEQWAAASLSVGWKMRHVAAYLVMPFRYSRAQVMVRLLGARGNFNRVADRVARQDAALW